MGWGVVWRSRQTYSRGFHVYRQILYTEQKRGRRVSYPACLSPTWDRNGMIGKARCSGIWCFFAYEFIFFVMFAF